ncbi:putative glycosyl transferase [Raoultella terrigena]|uniref:Putative glycosyl transferase n=1 Tax=Raoultella terrigena TaxID=577 RepID=A0A4U9D9T8_RAOTE|nr:putative glycosyl transferase [Raoultella terrigena]
MYRTLLAMAEQGNLDIATCNGRYVYESKNDIHPILPPDRLPSTGVLPGHVWLKQALDSRKFLHVTWLNIYRREFIMQHRFTSSRACAIRIFPGPPRRCWRPSACSTPASSFTITISIQNRYRTSRDNDDTLMRSARHYMKILEMLDAINQRYPDKVRHISACRWQIAKEGLGIIHTFDSMKDESKKHIIIKEFFDRGIWHLIWKMPERFRLRWRLGRRYLRIKRYRNAA